MATGLPEAALEASAVADPHATINADVEGLLTRKAQSSWGDITSREPSRPSGFPAHRGELNRSLWQNYPTSVVAQPRAVWATSSVSWRASAMAVWYARLDVEDAIARFKAQMKETALRRSESALARARTRDSTQAVVNLSKV